MIHDVTFLARKIIRSRDRDDSAIRRGHVQREVFTSMHGHLVIELGNIPYSNVPPGSTAFVDG